MVTVYKMFYLHRKGCQMSWKARVVSMLLAAPLFGFAADWSYHVKTDPFDNVTIKTARAVGPGWASVALETHSNGVRMAYFSGAEFECFVDCFVRVKFDDDAPVVFAAEAPRVISSLLVIKDFDGFMQRVAKAKVVTLRAKFFRRTQDLVVEIGAPLDLSRFAEAERLAALRKQCEAGAVSEDYAVCMQRALGQ